MTFASGVHPDHTVIFTLYRFGKSGLQGPGKYPQGTVLVMHSGALFSTTSNGGGYGYGTVFELIPTGAKYTFRLVHTFAGRRTGVADGAVPLGGLIEDSTGTLFGTTKSGGTQNAGTVFRLTPKGQGYSEDVIHDFGGTEDGKQPFGSLLLSSDGATLYGTTGIGGRYGEGTVYELEPHGNAYVETVLWSFGGTRHDDGANPVAGVVADAQGTLFGTTKRGGYSDLGTAFRVVPDGAHSKEALIYSFSSSGRDPRTPEAPLVVDKTGSLYGTAYEGGSVDDGAVFKLKKLPGFYKLAVLHEFLGSAKHDGKWPTAGLAFGQNQILYGTTTEGGNKIDAGTIFALSASGSTYRVLHSFSALRRGGAFPEAGVTPNGSGEFFGTTALGGDESECPLGHNYFPGCGTVFALTP